MLCVAFTVAVAWRGHADSGPTLSAGAFAASLLVITLLTGWTSAVPWTLVALAGAYAWSLGGAEVDTWAPAHAALLFTIAELAYWSLELRGRAHDAERLTERRAALVGMLAIGMLALSGVVLAATAVRLGSGIALDVVGAGAAVAAVAVLAALARS